MASMDTLLLLFPLALTFAALAPFATVFMAFEKKFALKRFVLLVYEVYLFSRLFIWVIRLRYASCFHCIWVIFCCSEEILDLYPETLFSIMDSVSMPLASPLMTLRLPYRLLVLLVLFIKLVTEAIDFTPFLW